MATQQSTHQQSTQGQRSGSGSLHARVVCPTGLVADTNTNAVIAPGENGEFEVLPGHIAFLTSVHAGVLVLGENPTEAIYAVGPGFVQVSAQGDVEVLVEQALVAGDVDTSAAEEARQQAASELTQLKDISSAEYKTAKASHDWAEAQLLAAKRIAN